MPYTQVMHKWKSGMLHQGSKTGPPVTNRKQAIAIMLSEKKKAEGGDEEYAAGPSMEGKKRMFGQRKMRGWNNG